MVTDVVEQKQNKVTKEKEPIKNYDGSPVNETKPQ